MNALVVLLTIAAAIGWFLYQRASSKLLDKNIEERREERLKEWAKHTDAIEKAQVERKAADADFKKARDEFVARAGTKRSDQE